MPRLIPSLAVTRLFSSPSQELEVEGGGRLSVYALEIDGTRVRATAPRLKVSPGMTLIGRVVGDDERPWAISLRIESAEFHSQQLASVWMRAVRVGLDRSRRGSVRVPAGGVAWLIAVNCQNVVDGDRVDGTVTDLSSSGVGFATSRTLRRGDRLIFRGRFFSEEFEAEVRVASVRESGKDGRAVVGAQYIDIDSANLARVERIMGGVGRPDPVDLTPLRELARTADEPQGWRRLFRRSADR
ncbi:MAG TPA: PilZ domain-containing protein [Gaiellales bacterium]|nr:PilZ domain-containing protein [Gaiellales bacterium]